MTILAMAVPPFVKRDRHADLIAASRCRRSCSLACEASLTWVIAWPRTICTEASARCSGTAWRSSGYNDRPDLVGNYRHAANSVSRANYRDATLDAYVLVRRRVKTFTHRGRSVRAAAARLCNGRQRDFADSSLDEFGGPAVQPPVTAVELIRRPSVSAAAEY